MRDSWLKDRLRAIVYRTPAHAEVYRLLRLHKPLRAAKFWRGERYGIGLVSNFYAQNMGGSLTHYALYRVLTDMNFRVLMIERPLSAAYMYGSLERIFIKSPYPKDNLAPQFKTKNDMYALNELCETFVVGSDQLFQSTLYLALGEFAALDWVDDRKPKIAYAASFGHASVWGEPDVLAELSLRLRRFDAFSVRENDAVDIAKRQFGVDAVQVLDPVFLCDVSVWEKMARCGYKPPSDFVCSYMLDPTCDKGKIISVIRRSLSLGAVTFSEFRAEYDYTEPLGDNNIQDLQTEERLCCFVNSRFVVTDSFHGMCFAIIFRKPFIAVLNNKRGASRFLSLLGLLGLEHRLVREENGMDLSAIPALCREAVDYKKVYGILIPEIARSRAWLFDALAKQKNPAD